MYKINLHERDNYKGKKVYNIILRGILYYILYLQTFVGEYCQRNYRTYSRLHLQRYFRIPRLSPGRL